MYRACSTWQYDVIAHLIEKHWGGIRLGYLTGERFTAFDDVWAGKPCWCVLKSHEGSTRFVSTLAEGRAVAVYAYRDIRDVVFSLMHKRRVSFETLYRQGMIHQILVNHRFWTSLPGVLCQRYEGLIANPVAGVEQLAAHLGLTLAPGEAEAVAQEYSFQANRQRMLRMGHHLRAEGIDLDDPRNVQYYDTHTLLHWNHMRDGRPGNWRELATPRQRAILARLCDRWLAENGYATDTCDPASAAGAQPGRGLSAVAGRLREEQEMARAWLACSLRCASMRYPRIARLVKRSLGIKIDRPPARPIETPAPTLVPSRCHRSESAVPPGPHVPTTAPSEPISRGDHVG
jgi:hypothetical protein